MREEFKEWVTPAIVGVASFTAGVTVGYLFKRYRDKNNLANAVENLRAEVVDQSIVSEEVQSEFTQMQFIWAENLERWNSSIQQANRVVVAFQDAGKKFLSETVDAVQHSVATHPSNGNTDDWDYTEEIKNRSPEHPYIIHREEFQGRESDYEQATLTYYKGDNILTDEGDVPVYNPEKFVGPLLFGHGSEDPSIVYVRNEKSEMEWEIILDEGYYQTEVLGAEVTDHFESDDLKHSHSVLKFRTTD